jgi:hypothetical protein
MVRHFMTAIGRHRRKMQTKRLNHWERFEMMILRSADRRMAANWTSGAEPDGKPWTTPTANLTSFSFQYNSRIRTGDPILCGLFACSAGFLRSTAAHFLI